MILSDKCKPFGFRQIERALVAFMQSLEARIHEVLPQVPVFVLWTGDNNLYMDTKFKTISKEVYEVNPRFVVKFTNFSEDTDSRTQKYNPYTYKSESEEKPGLFETNMRRLLVWVDTDSTMISSNFIDALSYMEIMYGIISEEHAFTYEYQGSTFQGAFSIDSDSDFQFPESDSSQINFTQKFPIRVQIHLLVPKPKTMSEKMEVRETRIEVEVDDKQTNLRKSKEVILDEEEADNQTPHRYKYGIHVKEPRPETEIDYTIVR